MYTVVTNQSAILSSVLVPIIVASGVLSLVLVMYLAMVYPGSPINDPSFGTGDTVDWVDVPFAKSDPIVGVLADAMG